MVQLQVTSAYISASANRFSSASDVSATSLVAFGSGKYVALWDAADKSDRGVFETLSGHESPVTCVKFVDDGCFASADEKGCLRIWKKADKEWSTICAISAHPEAISALAIAGNFIATGASDCLVKIWDLSREGKLSEVETIKLPGKLPLCLALSGLPGVSCTLLAIGSTDRKIQIYGRSDDAFLPLVTLPGHEDWIKSLAFCYPKSEKEPLILASGSHDSTIRLWNIEPQVQEAQSTSTEEKAVPDDILDVVLLDGSVDAEEGGKSISSKRHVFALKLQNSVRQLYSITFDALLVGHESGITSLRWRDGVDSSGNPALLSTSTDSSAIIWSPASMMAHNESASLWINQHRFGDVGGQRLGGFVGGLWADGGKEILAWGWNGGWRRWASVEGGKIWKEVGAISGHHSSVKGLGWSRGGEYLISTGPDQTTRIHAEQRAIDPGDSTAEPVWHEIGRPQVHGYDLLRAAFVDPLRFISIADEKVARVFDAPRNFVTLVQHLGIADSSGDITSRPAGATVPPLGLSNKGTTEEVIASVANDIDAPSRRPFEGELAAFTLWPEVEKVFGHGYELVGLAASNSGSLVATSCKASSAEHAVIRIYDTERWQPVGSPLPGHALTITRIAFSPDDRYVLSVSRDRTWRLFARQDDGVGYHPFAADKSHTRIIWDCAWSCEGDLFATASRDKTVSLWPAPSKNGPSEWKPVVTIKMKEAATAVAFQAANQLQKRLLAVGLETGEIVVFSGVLASPLEWTREIVIGHSLAHVDHVHQLEWRPKTSRIHQLASCSEDGTLKIMNFHLSEGP